MSNIKIHFDPAGQVEKPTLVLARKSGEKIGVLTNLQGLMFSDSMTNPSEFVFDVYKDNCAYWDDIQPLKIVWVAEWDKWYEMDVELSESNASMKPVSLTHLPEAELSQILLHNIEINTEIDMAREEYDEKNPTILYNPDLPSSSLLHRITEKAVNFKFGHIDSTIAKIQRTFSFDEISLYDALLEIAEEIHCLFVFDSMTDPDTGEILRIISAYDLESYCNDCHFRGEFQNTCPECGSTRIQEGYGEDTTIFISVDNIASEIGYSTDTDSVKNCFRLKAGDDEMSNAIRSCNPNGTSYIWYISDALKEDMSAELVEKLNAYDKKYEEYYTSHKTTLDVAGFNTLIEKYKKIDSDNEDLKTITSPVVGYPALIEVNFNATDMEWYLMHSLMPTVQMSDTTPEAQVEILTRGLSGQTVSINNIKSLSAAVAKNAVEYYAEALIDPRYKVEVDEGYTLQDRRWSGSLTVTDYSDEEQTASTGILTVNVDDNYENFVRQKIDRVLAKGEKKNYGIAEILKSENLAAEMKKYGLVPLERFRDSCQGCIDVLLDCGAYDKETHEDVYNKISVKYSERLQIIEAEIKVREAEIEIVKALKKQTEDAKTVIQKDLDFEKYLGEKLWKEFSAFRREDTYTNDNYISDGLSNAEILRNANEFIKKANNELFKSATLQHSINSSIKNLFTIKEFAPLREHFSVGNWMRISVDDNVYKLRLLSYDVDFENRMETPVEFSDVTMIRNGVTDVKSILSSAKKMSTSYSSIKHQAEQGSQSHSILDDWTTRGLDATAVNIMNSADNQTQTWDSHGMLFRRQEDFTDTYEPTQLKIVNSTIAITRDNWASVATAIGKFYYEDPTTQQLVTAYGINGETIVGKLILGEELGIYNSSGSLKFNKDGFLITNGINSFTVNPNNPKKLLALSKSGTDILYVDEKGMLHLKGDGSGLDISSNGSISGLSNRITANEEGIRLEIKRATGAEGELSTRINTTADGIAAEIKRATAVEGELSNRIKITADGLDAEIKRANKTEGELSNKISVTADGLSAEITRANEVEGKLSTRITANAEGLSLRVEKNGVISAINASSESISINASKINLNGVITANKTFQIKTDGSMVCTGGTIAGWNINSTSIYRGNANIGASGGMYFGSNGLSVTNKFKVDINGRLETRNLVVYDRIYMSTTTYGVVGCVASVTGSFYNGSGNLKIGEEMGTIELNPTNVVLVKKHMRVDSGGLDVVGNIVANEISASISISLNNNTIYNRIINNGSGDKSWKCGASGNLIPHELSNISGSPDIDGNSSGTLSIGSSNSYIKNLSYGGSLNKISDKRLKNDLGDLDTTECLRLLSGLKTKKFTYKSDVDNIIHYGMYAQDLRDLLKESNIGHVAALGINILSDDFDSCTKDLLVDEDLVRYSIDYEQFIPVLINGWKHHENIIRNLIEENKKLKEILNI